ncbi:hypothetical protein G3I40_45640 [Streptomyces sp. SID14478]|uniref:hypothetical protein n=1 Tax=Streptomyces sp. SID14478 TaxID=2706073 RepID=UPI0013E06230|nr:hypothetical protein [Streptomyces sp. SID14478]NEB82445.1 hypothetical protein [Streptomyces sp. SID14478]
MRRRGVVCVLAGALLIGFTGGDGGFAGHQKAWADGTPVVWTDDEMPELPLDSYEFEGADGKAYDRVEEAQRLLTQRCMVRHGFADFPLDPKYPGAGSSTTVRGIVIAGTGPVGTYDLAAARRWGYGWDPQRKIALPGPKGREMTIEESAVYYGDRHTERSGCYGEAYRRLERGVRNSRQMWAYVSTRESAVRKQAPHDPRLRRAFARWADCVEDKGFKRYTDPAAAYGAKEWKRGQDGNTTRTPREVGTAVADIECKRSLNTAGVWWSVAQRLQRRELALHKAEFEGARKGRDRLLANARAVLAPS